MSDFRTTINGSEVDVNQIFLGTARRGSVGTFYSNTSSQFQGQGPYTTYGSGPGSDQFNQYGMDRQRFTNFITSGSGDLANQFAAPYVQYGPGASASYTISQYGYPWCRCLVVVAGGGGGAGGGGYFDDNDGCPGHGGGSGGLIVGWTPNVNGNTQIAIQVSGASADASGGGQGENRQGPNGGTTTVTIGGVTRYWAYGGQGGNPGTNGGGAPGYGGGYTIGSGSSLIYGGVGNRGNSGQCGNDDDNDMSNQGQKDRPKGGASIFGAFGWSGHGPPDSGSLGGGGAGGHYGNDDEFDGYGGHGGAGGFVRIYFLSGNI